MSQQPMTETTETTMEKNCSQCQAANVDLLHSHSMAEVLNPDSTYPVLMTIEHASPNAPEGFDLGITPQEDTIAYFYDVGIPEVARHLAAQNGATTIFGKNSRLVIDLNRHVGQDDLIVENEYYGIKLPANTNLSEEEKQRRITQYYEPYHDTIRAQLSRLRDTHPEPLFFSLHSYPRHERGLEEEYPWDFACLYNKDNRMAKIFMDHIRENYPDIVVGDNEPYDLREFQTGSILLHGEQNNLPYLVIEIAIDRMQTPEDIAYWSNIINECLEKCITQIIQA